MTKKALLVGINYTNIPYQQQLHGCIDDIVNMSELLVDSFDYDINNIIMLRDDDATSMPTRINILSHLSNLVKQSANLSEIWFHYSGHGSQINAVTNGKYNNLNEVILPVDYQTNGFIIDDEIYNIIKNVKCNMILVFDSCHSGSMCELQWSFLYSENTIIKSINNNKSIANPNIFCFSSCKDSQTCADAYNNVKTQNVGIFTDSLIYCLRTNHKNVDVGVFCADSRNESEQNHHSIQGFAKQNLCCNLKLYNDICVYISSNGFTQTPLLSCSTDSPGIFTT